MSQAWSSFYIWSLSNKIIIPPGTVNIPSKDTIQPSNINRSSSKNPSQKEAGWDTAAFVTSNSNIEWIFHSHLAY